ncbi:MAG: hypothetical protein HC917_05520 [Richelia sp. SM2_1_7]|nr:hypothetical protein [Richelia sp. SM2_1_7]
MPLSFTQVPPNSTGNKMRTRTRVQGLDIVHEQAVYQGALPTYYFLADAVAFAANKHMISLYNATGSGALISIKKLYLINLQLSSASGVALRQNVIRFSSEHTGGTLITPTSCDSANGTLPTQITCRTGATITDVSILFPLTFSNDEVGTTQAFPSTQLLAGINWFPEGSEIQEVRLREGEGLTVKNITSTTVGSFAYLFVVVIDEL